MSHFYKVAFFCIFATTVPDLLPLRTVIGSYFQYTLDASLQCTLRGFFTYLTLFCEP